MRRVETGPRYIFFTRISLKHRYSETDKLDAELTATAFEKVKETSREEGRNGQKAAREEGLARHGHHDTGPVAAPAAHRAVPGSGC